MKVFVDTSALLALVDEDDEFHRDATVTLRALRGNAELITHSYVLIETIALVRRRLGPSAELHLMDTILPILSTIWVDEVIHRSAISSYRAASRSASVVDHVSFEVMRAVGLDVAFAFDADFERHGFGRPSSQASEPSEKRLSESPATYGPDSISHSDLVSVAEIAARSGRPTNTVQSWRRRHRDFPAPVAQLATGPVWLWPAIGQWIEARNPARGGGDPLSVPAGWGRTATGEPMPDVVGLVRRSREGH